MRSALEFEGGMMIEWVGDRFTDPERVQSRVLTLSINYKFNARLCCATVVRLLLARLVVPVPM